MVLPESGNVCRIAIWRLSLQPRSLWVFELGKTAHKLGARKRALLSHIQCNSMQQCKASYTWQGNTVDYIFEPFMN